MYKLYYKTTNVSCLFCLYLACQLLIGQFFSRELHENERNWLDRMDVPGPAADRRGGGGRGGPLSQIRTISYAPLGIF